MKIFVSHSSGFDYKNRLYKPLCNSKINNSHKIFLPHEEGKDILTKEIIKNSDILIAEVSRPSTGQGIELGWANDYKIPIICIHLKDTKPSGSLKHLTENFITYENVNELIGKLTVAFDKINSFS
jgi:hypothetical protein